MARPIWTGAITFGLVSVPVTMYSATREHDVSFHQFQQGTGDRIRYQRVNERTGDEVDYADIVRGADIGGGSYVMLDQDELDSVAPGRSRSMEIQRFVGLDEIDPIYYQKTYYLAPGSEETAKTYALLRDAMSDANRAAVATFVMRGREYLAAIRADGDLLVLETMFFADEVRDPKEEIDAIPGRSNAKPAELAMAGQLIDSMSGRWQPSDYRDTYTDRVNELIEAKKAGAEVTVAAAAPEPTNVTDLLEALRRSVDAAKRGRQAGEAERPSSRRRGGTAKRAEAPSTGRQGGAVKGGAAKGGAAKGGAAKGGASGRGRGADELATLTKSELLALARELEVPGRSTMSRPELEKAVKAARKPRRGRVS